MPFWNADKKVGTKRDNRRLERDEEDPECLLPDGRIETRDVMISN